MALGHLLQKCTPACDTAAIGPASLAPDFWPAGSHCCWLHIDRAIPGSCINSIRLFHTLSNGRSTLSGKEAMKTTVVYLKVGLLFLDISARNEGIITKISLHRYDWVVRFVNAIFVFIMRPSHLISSTHAHTL
jgi:hypothetical protein